MSHFRRNAPIACPAARRVAEGSIDHVIRYNQSPARCEVCNCWAAPPHLQRVDNHPRVWAVVCEAGCEHCRKRREERIQVLRAAVIPEAA